MFRLNALLADLTTPMPCGMPGACLSRPTISVSYPVLRSDARQPDVRRFFADLDDLGLTS
jgi:hypothetical protein